ncbi:MAG: TetR family transcriptional regulator [Acidimicrobiales bacterium]
MDADRDPGAAPTGRRERKKRRTRDDLMRQAARLFAANGFDETTTEDIAEAADLSQRTFFRHFSSKEAVLYGDMDELRIRVRNALMGRPAGEPPILAVRHAIMTLADNYEFERDHRFLQAKLAAAYPSVSAYSRAVVQAEWEKELIAALSQRLGVDSMLDPRPEIVAGAAMSALRVSIRRWTSSGGRENLLDLVGEAFDALAQLSELAVPSEHIASEHIASEHIASEHIA